MKGFRRRKMIDLKKISRNIWMSCERSRKKRNGSESKEEKRKKALQPLLRKRSHRAALEQSRRTQRKLPIRPLPTDNSLKASQS